MKPVSASSSIPASLEPPTRTSPWLRPKIRWQFESEAARLLLQQNGLDDINRLFALADRSVHSHKGRSVSRVELVQPTGERLEAFVKLNWGRRRLIPRMTDLKTRQAFQSLPAREWRGIGELRSLGLLVPERLALVQCGRLWFQEAVLLKRVPPQHSLDDLIRNGKWEQWDQETQQEILAGVVGVLQWIHHAGFGWRGTCTRHFFPTRAASGNWQFWLIDCEGIHPHLTHRTVNRDYRKLQRALEISGANHATLRWFQNLIDRAKQSPNNPPPGPRNELLMDLQPRLKPSH